MIKELVGKSNLGGKLCSTVANYSTARTFDYITVAPLIFKPVRRSQHSYLVHFKRGVLYADTLFTFPDSTHASRVPIINSMPACPYDPVRCSPGTDLWRERACGFPLLTSL